MKWMIKSKTTSKFYFFAKNTQTQLLNQRYLLSKLSNYSESLLLEYQRL